MQSSLIVEERKKKFHLPIQRYSTRSWFKEEHHGNVAERRRYWTIEWYALTFHCYHVEDLCCSAKIMRRNTKHYNWDFNSFLSYFEISLHAKLWWTISFDENLEINRIKIRLRDFLQPSTLAYVPFDDFNTFYDSQQALNISAVYLISLIFYIFHPAFVSSNKMKGIFNTRREKKVRICFFSILR